MRSDRIERRLRRRLVRLPLGARQELIRILASPSDVRADLIRQMWQRPDSRELAEVMMDIEVEPLMRLEVMQALKESL